MKIQTNPPARFPGASTALDATVAELHRQARKLHGAGDRRGLFFALYAPTVDRIAREIRAGTFRDPEAVTRVARGLAERALGSLNGANPDGRSREAWRSANGLAAQTGVSDERVLGAALNAHLTVDLPDALRAAGVDRGFRRDLQALGRALVDETTRIQRAPAAPYEAAIAALYERLPLAPQIERLLGRPVVRRLGYAVLLDEALEQSQWNERAVDHFVDAAFENRRRWLVGGP
jgi:hypothetical protein